MESYTIDQVLARLPRPSGDPIPRPAYTASGNGKGVRLALAVESMRRHMTDEGWEIMKGLGEAGYVLAGHDLVTIGPDGTRYPNLTDVVCALDYLSPEVVLIQDKREWEGLTADRSRDPRMRFTNVERLADRDDVFKLTVLKDAHQQQDYNRAAAEEIGCHAWVCYYHPRIVAHLAPYARPEHLVRTYHTLDKDLVPPYTYTPEGRGGCILSGAISSAYPLRKRLFRFRALLPETYAHSHPGYHRNGCETPNYLKMLSRFKVSICTASIYGYALRKIIESTACGCMVITDLPVDEILPYIDDNLYRVRPETTPEQVGRLVRRLLNKYDPELQEYYATLVKKHYDYRVVCKTLTYDIENMKRCCS